MNNPSGMDRAELDFLASGLKPLPKAMKNRDGSKAAFDRQSIRKKNRAAKKARIRNARNKRR